MVLDPLGTARVGLTSNICSQVQDPAKELLGKNTIKSADRSIFRIVLEATERKESFLVLGYKNHVTGKMVGCFMVLRMGNSPRVIRNQKSRMQDPAHSVIYCARIRKGSVSTFVGKNPETSSKKTLDNSVQSPCNKTSGLERNLGNVYCPEITKQDNKEKVAKHIAK